MQFVSASPFMVILLLLRAFRSFAFTNVRVEESAQQEKQPKKAKFKITPKIVQKIEKKVGAQGYKQGYQIAFQILKERVEIPIFQFQKFRKRSERRISTLPHHVQE